MKHMKCNSFPIHFQIQEVVDKCVAAEIESVFDIMELEDAERNKLLSFNQVIKVTDIL